MADTIGSQSFIRLDGDANLPGIKLSEITRPNADGRAWQQLGTRADPFSLRGITNVTSSAAANTLLTTYSGMIGSIVALSMRSQSLGNFLVLDAKVTDRRFCATAIGGITGGGWLVESQWNLIKTP